MEQSSTDGRSDVKLPIFLKLLKNRLYEILDINDSVAFLGDVVVDVVVKR